jgi:hypothetical protein
MTTPPTDQFVPLLATPSSGEKQEFQSFEKAAGVSERASQNCQPQLSVQRENGRITAIRIQCICGQTIDLSCVYEAAQPIQSPQSKEPPRTEEIRKQEQPTKQEGPPKANKSAKVKK